MRTTNWDGRGIEKKEPNVDKEKAIVEKIKDSSKTMVTSIFWAATIVAIESLAIWLIWNYIVTNFQLTYPKIVLGLIMVRLILRSTTKLSDFKK